MTKKELRAAMKKQNLSLSPEERAAASGRIFRRVAESEPFGTARCVAFFCALPDEPEDAADKAVPRDSLPDDDDLTDFIVDAEFDIVVEWFDVGLDVVDGGF